MSLIEFTRFVDGKITIISCVQTDRTTDGRTSPEHYIVPLLTDTNQRAPSERNSDSNEPLPKMTMDVKSAVPEE